MVGTGAFWSTEGARHSASIVRRPLGGGRDLDRPAPGALPALARPDVRRDRRPGSGRRDAAQRRPHRPRQPRRPVRRPARHRQDVARPDPGQGGQLHEPPGRRRLRSLPVVRLDPRGDHARPRRDRRRQQPRHRRRPRACASGSPIRPDSSAARSTSSTRRTRSPGRPGTRSSSRIEEPPDFVIFMFASTEPSAFPPAILSRLQRYDVRRLTVAEIEGKLDRILAADGRDADPDGDPPDRPAGRRRDARRRVDARPAAVGRARADRRGPRPRPPRPGRRRGRRGLRRRTSSAATGRPASRCSTRSRSAGGTSGRCSTRPSRRSAPS